MGSPLLIALTGLAGSGKSTAAAQLAARGFHVHKFAGPLKEMLRSLYREAGVPPDDIERRIEGDLKEKPCELLGGQTPRHAMQTLGTEWGRGCISEDLWVRAWTARAAVELFNGRNVVVDDCRFENEAQAALDQLGIIIEIVRPGQETLTSGHSSENGIPDNLVSARVINDSTPEVLVERILRAARKE